MKFKVIFWENEQRIEEQWGIRCLQVQGSNHYYEKVGKCLIEYIFVNEQDIERLRREMKARPDQEIILIVQELIKLARVYEKIGLKREKPIRVIVKHEMVNSLSIPAGGTNNYFYIPQMNNEEVMALLPIFLQNDKSYEILTGSESSEGSTLLMGRKDNEVTPGKLVYELFQKWHYVESHQRIRVDLFSHKEIGIQVLTELEDVLREYIAEGTQLEINWYNDTIDESHVYFLVKASHNYKKAF